MCDEITLPEIWKSEFRYSEIAYFVLDDLSISVWIKAKRLSPDQKWYEIDDIQDLDIAESMFAPEKERTALISRRFGGYWRYPGMLDFCYLVNSYYPPKKMLDEIRSNFDVLIRQYPSGMYVNSLLAARNFSLRQDQILVGNGAAELINPESAMLLAYTSQAALVSPEAAPIAIVSLN